MDNYHPWTPTQGTRNDPDPTPRPARQAYPPDIRQRGLTWLNFGSIQPLRLQSPDDPFSTQKQRIELYLIKSGFFDPNSTVDSRVWYLSETGNLGRAVPSHFVEQCRALNTAPPVEIYLHVEFFTEAVNIFRSDFFLPKSLRDCVRYIQVVRQNGNLKDRVNSDVWRANTEASSMKFAEFWVGMLKKCWNDVKMLGHDVVWKVESQENRVGTVVEVG